MNARPLFRWLRDAWLILGLTFALWVALEVLYRGQARLRRTIRGDVESAAGAWASPNHPNANAPWWRELMTSGRRLEGELRYDPFRGWWPGPRRGPYVNVDAEGRRVTIQRQPNAGSRGVVYMLGGSVMWGWVVRDSFTIPSLVARRLDGLGYPDVRVINLAQSTFDFAQNAATFQRELRHGRIPTVAVFLDGNNEVAPVFQSGEVGHILNEALIAQRFSRSRALSSDLFAVVIHSQLVERIVARTTTSKSHADLRLCDAVAASYDRQVRAVAGAASAFGVQTLFFWQPMLATTHKRLSAWEREIPADSAWSGMVRRCTDLVDARMQARGMESYFPLHALFDDDSASVFTDNYGHLTERASQVVADRIAAAIVARLPNASAVSPSR